MTALELNAVSVVQIQLLIEQLPLEQRTQLVDWVLSRCREQWSEPKLESSRDPAGEALVDRIKHELNDGLFD